MPKVQTALELYDILSESNIDLRQPVGLEEQLLMDDALDTEVGQSMLQLLQVLHLSHRPTCLPIMTAPRSPPLNSALTAYLICAGYCCCCFHVAT